MAFEELPDEWNTFFEKGGELPASLLTQAPTPAPAQAPTPTPAAAVEAPAPTPAPAVIDPPPVVPTANPHLEQLLALKDRQIADVSEQIKSLQAQITKQNEVPIPDATLDPLGHMTGTLAKLQAQLTAMQEAQTAAATQTQQQRDASNFMQAINSQVQSFKATHDDYDDAYKHMINIRRQDFVSLGMTEAQVNQAIGNEEMQITRQAISVGKNPAELVYDAAKRYGFQTKAPAVKPENKLETIRKGIDASQTVDRATPPDAGKITIDNIAGASEADIDRMVKSDWEGIFGMKKGVV